MQMKHERAYSRKSYAWQGAAGVLWLVLWMLGCAEPVRPLLTDVTGSASDGFVFVRVEGDETDLWRARLSDGLVEPFLQTPGRQERWPIWSPESRRLVYQVRTQGVAADLFLWEPGQPEEVRLTETPAWHDEWMVWAPDGRRFAFVSTSASASELLVMSLPERTVQTLASAAGEAEVFLRPNFSPDGEEMVFEAMERGQTARSGLRLLTGSEAPRVLTSGQDSRDEKAVFVRAGDALLLQRTTDGKTHDLFRLPLAGGLAVALTETPEVDEMSLKISPVQDEFAFVSNEEGNYEVYLQRGGDSSPWQVTETLDLDELSISWSPDGERLLVTARPRSSAPDEAPGPVRVLVLDRAGAVLLETPGQMPSWMPPWE